jgi:hypothetical protein
MVQKHLSPGDSSDPSDSSNQWYEPQARKTGRKGKKKNTLWLFNIAMENPSKMEVLMGKSTINGPFSMAMLNNQRVSLLEDLTCPSFWLLYVAINYSISNLMKNPYLCVQG